MKRFVLAGLLASACASRPQAPATRAARIELACPYPEATVWVDDRYIGSCALAAGGLVVTPGPRRVEIRHDDHHPRYFELELSPGEVARLPVSLVPLFPLSAP